MLLRLRDDLDLHSSSPTKEGHPCWTIHDPVRDKFFQIEWRVFEVLCRWEKGTAERIAKAVNLETTLEISTQFVQQVEHFLSTHQLCRIENIKSSILANQFIPKSKESWWSWLLHHYLFFRVPIFKSDKFLTHALPYVSFLYSKIVKWLVFLALFLGLFLAAHQWDHFLGQFVDLISVRGAILFGFALLFVKIAHEFGHAFTAKIYGCRVPTMGVAFLVLWPMLYTDTNESWKLSSRRQRLIVASAGVIVELAIAVFATLAWSFLPSGGIKDMAFVIATTTWISSVIINASPFMRFDGYYILSDWWGVPNLHKRSFDLARWWLRRKLFDLDDPPPEEFVGHKKNLLILFAFVVWVYRLVLFLGIAVLVYSFFIKAVGIFLFAIEISWFILRPLSSELKEWWIRRIDIFARTRVWLVLAFLLFIIGVLFVPWRSSISIDAVIEAEPYSIVYVKTGGRLSSFSLSEGDYVERGEMIAKFNNPKQMFKFFQLSSQILVQKELEKLATFDGSLKQQNATIAAKLVRLETEQTALKQEIDSMNIYAPTSGVISEISRGLYTRQWLGKGHRLLAIKGNSGVKVTGYIPEDDISRIHKTGSCTFSLLRKYNKGYLCSLITVGQSAESFLKDKMLASLYGGSILVKANGEKLVPDQSIYKVVARFEGGDLNLKQQALGILKLEADEKSIIERFSHWSLSVIIRESGM